MGVKEQTTVVSAHRVSTVIHIKSARLANVISCVQKVLKINFRFVLNFGTFLMMFMFVTLFVIKSLQELCK